MEDRTLLSPLMVTNNNDSGAGSLRAAIVAAASGDTINFANNLKGQTITLTSGPLTLGVNLTIDGLGADKLTVSGGGTEGVFVVSPGMYGDDRQPDDRQRPGRPGRRDRQLRHADGRPLHADRQHGRRRQRR